MKVTSSRKTIISGALGTMPAPGELSATPRANRLGFVALFTLLCFFVYALIFLLPHQWLLPINEHTARALGFILNLTGHRASVIGSQVWAEGFAVQIIPECTALLTVGVFACFVACYPAPVYKKLHGLLCAIPAIYLGNLLRLAVIFISGIYSKRLFDVLHVYLGQIYTMALVILSCLFYIQWVTRINERHGTIASAIRFLFRFVLLSTFMFFVWMEIHLQYVTLIDRFMVAGFSFFGYRLIIPQNIILYWETFNVVTFTSLLIATELKPWTRKIKHLACGLCILFVFHLIHRTNNALMAAFGFLWVMPLDLILCAIAQYVLPVLMWLWLITFSSRMHVSKPGKRVDVLTRRRVNG